MGLIPAILKLRLRPTGGPQVFYVKVPRSFSSDRSVLPTVFFFLENELVGATNLVDSNFPALRLYLPELLLRSTGGPHGTGDTLLLFMLY